MSNYNTEIEKSQLVKLYKELSEKFTPKRQMSELLADSYQRVGLLQRAERVKECGTFLEFRKPVGELPEPPSANPVGAEAVGSSDGWKLHTANFCRDRLCPMCSWRRSYKIFAQISQIMNVIADDYAFVFLTLTVPNCDPERLCKLIDELQEGFHKLTKYKRFKAAVRGFFKVLEVTRNRTNGTYHPHFHCILAVPKNYFIGRDYINHDEWLSMWRKAMKDDSITQVDVRRCKPKDQIQEGEAAVKALSSAVAEVAKYSVKAADYILPADEEATDDIVLTLLAALTSRRLCSFGGIFDQVRKKLQLDDCEDGDLVHVDGTEMRSDVAYMIRRYNWSAGAYKLLDERRDIK